MQFQREERSRVTSCSTRCPCCFSGDAAVLWLECVSESFVHDLSLQTCGSSIMSRGACLFKIKQENISLFLLLHLFLASCRSSPLFVFSLSFSVLLLPIKGSFYCLYRRIGVVNRCRGMGYLYWQANTERVSWPSSSSCLPTLTSHTPLMDCPPFI